MKTFWLAGHSGSGKTTVAKVLNGIDLDSFGHWEDENGNQIQYKSGNMADTDRWIVPPEKVPIGKRKLLAGSMSNFDEIKELPWAGRIWLRVSKHEQAKRLQSPERTNPFGKDPRELERAQRGFRELPGDPNAWIIVDADRTLKEVVRDVRSIIEIKEGKEVSINQWQHQRIQDSKEQPDLENIELEE
jgi:energy-coupling factor transporter ATP-binding protein EcfA2